MTKQQESGCEFHSAEFCLFMHEGSQQTNVSDIVISFGLRAAVLQAEL